MQNKFYFINKAEITRFAVTQTIQINHFSNIRKLQIKSVTTVIKSLISAKEKTLHSALKVALNYRIICVTHTEIIRYGSKTESDRSKVKLQKGSLKK